MKTTNLYRLIIVFTLFSLVSPSIFSISARTNSWDSPVSEKERLDQFGNDLEGLRQLLKIPGLSAAIVKDQQLIWSKGFGLSDIAKQIPASPQTPYQVASLTKTFTSTILMQLVEQGKLDLKDPMSKYSPVFKDDSVRVWHLLTHTSERIPGWEWAYNGNRFALLTAAIDKSSGKTFRELLAKSILDKLEMRDSVPGEDVTDDPENSAKIVGTENLNRYGDTLKRLATSYKLNTAGQPIQAENPQRDLNAANGLITTATDLAKYDIAIDRNLLLKKQTQEKAFTPAISDTGETLPYGLGWMVTSHRDLKLVWHNGYLPDRFSAVFLKVPERNITMILLANSDALSAPFALGRGGDALNSVFVCDFLRTFVFTDSQGHSPAPLNYDLSPTESASQIKSLEEKGNGYLYDWDLRSRALALSWLGDTKRSSELFNLYFERYSKAKP